MATQLFKRPAGSLSIHAAYRIEASELTAAATTETVDVATLPAGAVVEFCWADLAVAFTDAGSITDVGLEVGSTADPDSLVTSLELMSGSPSTGRHEQRGAWEAGTGLAVKAKFTATGANLGDGTDPDLDAGAVDVHIVYREF